MIKNFSKNFNVKSNHVIVLVNQIKIKEGFKIKFTNRGFHYLVGLKNSKNIYKVKINSMLKFAKFEIKYANNNYNEDGKENQKISEYEKKNMKNFYNDIKEDEIKFTENPYLNKKEIISLDKVEKENINRSVNIHIERLGSNHMDNLEIHEILDLISKMLKGENQNPDLWYKLLNQFNELLCSHKISKIDIINFLELLNFFKPKILEKKLLPKDVTQIGSENLLSKKHEEEYFKMTQPKDIFGQFALHLKKNLSSNVVTKFFEIEQKFKNKENIEENVDDLLGLYQTLFKNIELKIIDDIANGRQSYDHKEAVIFIKSFSCAEEGTNMLYELLMRKIIKHFSELTLSEIEIILNYLPHELYNNKEFQVDSEEKYVEMGRNKSVSEFYSNVYDRVINELTKASNELFLNLFQGCLKIKFVDIDVIGSFLLEFDNKLSKIINRNENKISDYDKKKFVFDFLQILTYFIRNDAEEKFLDSIDFEILWKSLYDVFLNKYLNVFTLKEFTTIFWVMYHFKAITLERINFFENSIRNLLLGYINDPKSKIDTMGYETHLRYYDNFNIDPYDVEAIKFFIESNDTYKGQLLGLLAKTLKSIELENTHPISRKLFHF